MNQEQTLKCAECNRPLLHFRVYFENDAIKHKIKANCPFCKENSYLKEIRGKFNYGPIGKDETGCEPTVVEDIDYNPDGITYFKLVKGKR